MKNKIMKKSYTLLLSKRTHSILYLSLYSNETIVNFIIMTIRHSNICKFTEQLTIS